MSEREREREREGERERERERRRKRERERKRDTRQGERPRTQACFSVHAHRVTYLETALLILHATVEVCTSRISQ